MAHLVLVFGLVCARVAADRPSTSDQKGHGPTAHLARHLPAYRAIASERCFGKGGDERARTVSVDTDVGQKGSPRGRSLRRQRGDALYLDPDHAEVDGRSSPGWPRHRRTPRLVPRFIRRAFEGFA
jgi:hypothetical protein